MLIEIKPIAVCPMCKGTHLEYSIRHHKHVNCTLCNGRGWIPSVACKGCGRPAWKLWPVKQRPIIQFCGLEECFGKLVNIRVVNRKIIPAIVRVTSNIHVPGIPRANQRHGAMEDIKRGIIRNIGPAMRANEIDFDHGCNRDDLMC